MSSHASFEPLTGAEGQPTPVLRHGDTVLRPAAPWTPTVHALLNHLEDVGFTGSPCVVGDGYDDQGHEVVGYIDGDSVHPHAWSDEGVWSAGRLLRDLHEATASFRPPHDAVWRPWPFHSDAPGAIISHRDAGPWHTVARDGLPVAYIDWTTAGPTDRLDEVAGAAWWNAQLHDDDIAERQNLPDAAARARQLRLFLDGYGLTDEYRRGFVTRMIEYAVRDCAGVAIAARITPESDDVAPLWALAWQARSAAWMLRHRPLLERAVTT
ncbi:aminoglycoside phosphotransferase family protein [Actinomadura sp. 7K507]|uniref:aminoglycoside phosphotransferase family protein n=1 Tax=Actinomadura sp. 7K507 TaxID=2530365 RepID=UPI0010499976|nr:aminoglycoside phosphotransferase family protein [Actinomadura sp. 7K507]TDC90455.1 aminoglycoside phosphotransferase family protein [Actinomadura sp. 7K507]